MSKSIKDIEEAIRRKREVLNRAGERFGVRSPYVLKKSQELDSLLNEYSVLSMSSQKRVKNRRGRSSACSFFFVLDPENILPEFIIVMIIIESYFLIVLFNSIT